MTAMDNARWERHRDRIKDLARKSEEQRKQDKDIQEWYNDYCTRKELGESWMQ